MNESFTHHVVRVALILGVVIGIGGFSLLLYISDFWSSGGAIPAQPGVTVEHQDDGPPVSNENADFAQRAASWVFGAPQGN